MAAPSIERTVPIGDGGLDLPLDEVWRLIGTAEGWSEWLVDEADVDVHAGGEGEVTDDGERRVVRVESVRHGAGITFVWSSGDDASRVTLEIDETEAHRRVLRITEEPLAACADCPMRADARVSRWDLRECLLCLTARATSRV